MRSHDVSRRRLISSAGAAAMIVPRRVLGGAGYRAPSDKLNLAGVGVGGVGQYYLKGCETENIAVLCDVDPEFAAPVFQRYPSARIHRDFRVMLEKEKDIDAVVIGTPDHSHAVVAMAAMQAGKHVYCAKPMTRTIAEARRLAALAREAKVATQMSVQSCASNGACTTAEWIQAGAVGAVREVHVWTDRPIWPQGLPRPEERHAVPQALDWDLWLGPAPARPYHPVYHPSNWRGWCDFGTGALGDMGCHTLHVIVRALNFGHPTGVHASSTVIMQPVAETSGGRLWIKPKKAAFPETFPMSSVVTWDFPARDALPPVRLHWYEGGLKPVRPPEMEPGRALPAAGILFIGEKGVLLSGFTGGPSLIPDAKTKAYEPPPKSIPRSIGHYQEWIQACKGGKPANCEFGFGSHLTEIALLGVIAIRTGRQLAWDPQNMRFPNDADANQCIDPPYRAGWSL